MSIGKKASNKKKKNPSLAKRILAKSAIVLASIVAAFLLISVLQVLILKSGSITWTPLMAKRHYEARHNGQDYEERQKWVAYEDISPNMVRAVIASEDNLFQKHNGFSENGLRRAWNELWSTGKVKHGGSTISQQTAKNVFTFATHTIFRKGIEAWYTVLIETFWGKQRIMEVYLNVIEFGDGIYGVGAASEYFYRHPARSLTKSESALMATCLPNPHKMHVNRPSAYMKKRQANILNLMPKMGRIELE